MVGPPRLQRRNAQFVRSQLAFELFLWVLAVVSALLFIRLCLKLLSAPIRVVTVQIVYDVTNVIVWPLTIVPGAERQLVGNAGLPDFTAVAIVVLIPLTFSLGGRVRSD